MVSLGSTLASPLTKLEIVIQSSVLKKKWTPKLLFIFSGRAKIIKNIQKGANFLRERKNRKVFGNRFGNHIWRKGKTLNGEYWHPGIWWLFIHAPWCPISPHTHCTDCNKLSWFWRKKIMKETDIFDNLTAELEDMWDGPKIWSPFKGWLPNWVSLGSNWQWLNWLHYLLE